MPPRQDRWTHLSLCVLDAVFSIGARYSTTCRTVRVYASFAGLPHVLGPAADVAAGAFTATEEPVAALVQRIEQHSVESFARAVLRNRQRTSPRGGVLKTEAALAYGAVLQRNGLLRLADVGRALADDARIRAAEAQLARVPGHGANGVRVGYLWMLAGSDDVIKPDRMVLGWLTALLGRSPSAPEARTLLSAASADLGVTAWQVDHAMWNAQRTGRTCPRR